jgi:hypothetical protein
MSAAVILERCAPCATALRKIHHSHAAGDWTCLPCHVRHPEPVADPGADDRDGARPTHWTNIGGGRHTPSAQDIDALAATRGAW